MPRVYRWWQSAASALCCLLLGSSAEATMVLSNAIIHFEPGESTRQDVEISNVGNEPLYVLVEPKVVLNPGRVDEERVPIAGNPREHGLLVTPNKLVIPAGAAKTIRLVNIGGSGDRERIYRITARPITGPVEAKSSGLKVLIGYEVLAIVYPQRPQPDLQVSRSGRDLKVTNGGNTNVYLQEGLQCASADLPPEQCTALPGKRIYPGMEWSYTLPEDLPVRFYHSVGTRNFVEDYP